MDEIISLLKNLCEAPGPAGFEQPAARQAAELLAPYCDEVTVDRLGNVIGRKRCGKPSAPSLMLVAHLDQIGFLVSGITDEGFLRVVTLGGVDERMLPSCEVKVLADPPLYGVVTCTPPHLQTKEEQDKPTPLSALFIDVGLSAKEAAEKIPVGTPAVFAEALCQLSPESATGCALDDRAGFAALIDALKQTGGKELFCDLIVVGSVREETGSAGAMTAAYALSPDAAIAVDVSHAKTPDAPADKTFAFGGGVMIGIGPNLHRWISKKFTELAKAHEMPCQFEVMEGSTFTDAWPIQITGNGIPCGLLSIPLRYMHTPIETLRLSDLRAVSELLACFILDFRGGVGI